MELTQTALARNMGVAQAAIAQLEQRNDSMCPPCGNMSRRWALSVIADMPGQGPVPLTGLGDRRLASADDDSNEELTT